MSKGLDDEILRGKEKFVLELVDSISKILELDYKLKVVFCDGFTPMGQKALACIQVASATIYVSRTYLIKMPLEEIRRIIIHEITHMFELEHNAEFNRKMAEISAGTWTPIASSGIAIIDGNKRVETPKKSDIGNEEEIDKTRCNYHLCLKETKTRRCIHCRRYFCDEHIKPYPPRLPEFDYPNKVKEWENRKNAHPCPAYYLYLIRKEKERNKLIAKSLQKLSFFKKIDDNEIEITGEIQKPLESKDDKKLPVEKKDNANQRLRAKDVICHDCGKDLLNSKKEFYHDKNENKMITLCSECSLKKGEKPIRSESRKISKKWKVTLIVLTIIACISVYLFAKTLIGL